METETVVELNGKDIEHAEALAPDVQRPAVPIDVSVLAPPIVSFASRVTGERFATQEALQKHYAECRRIAPNQMVVTPEFQNYIAAPPGRKESLKATYSQNDELTVNSWFDEWRANKIENIKLFPDFADHTAMEAHGEFAYKPIVISGAGPSLKKNGHLLGDRGGIGLVACLHTFAFYHDLGVKVDYFLNLDAGDITIPEMSQGGKEAEEHYWEATKDYTLVTALHCNPRLHKRWKGRILWFDTALPGMNESINDKRLEDFRLVFETGGNTLGACHYMAKAILGGSPLIFVGADFSFSHDRKFHPFDSPYDKKFSGVVPAMDVFGYKVATWPSYFGFKAWFEHVAMGGIQGNTPGTYINATEGGILGAYPDGNMMQIQQRRLADVLGEYNLHKKLPMALADKSRLWMLY